MSIIPSIHDTEYGIPAEFCKNSVSTEFRNTEFHITRNSVKIRNSVKMDVLIWGKGVFTVTGCWQSSGSWRSKRFGFRKNTEFRYNTEFCIFTEFRIAEFRILTEFRNFFFGGIPGKNSAKFQGNPVSRIPLDTLLKRFINSRKNVLTLWDVIYALFKDFSEQILLLRYQDFFTWHSKFINPYYLLRRFIQRVNLKDRFGKSGLVFS